MTTAATPKPNTSRTPEPFTLVIFGASGDLTKRKLMPAVYRLHRQGRLPPAFAVVGFARSAMSDDGFREEMRSAVSESSQDDTLDEATWSEFAAKLHYHTAKAYDDTTAYRSLRGRLADISGGSSDEGNCLFYLATHPSLFGTIIEHLHGVGLSRRDNTAGPWSRVIIEKPFGRDLPTSRALTERIRSAFSEPQIFRIDHYLGKETVQNILVLRFANSIFEPIWNQKYVDHVQITVSEAAGVEARGKYYDDAGALRDMVQNHMMQLLCLVAMEPPTSLQADAVRDEKVKVLDALRPIPLECVASGVVRGQYAAGASVGSPVPSYRDEQDVADDSATETYVALKAYVDNWRWSEVPFYLRTGKRLPARVTEIGIHFKPVPKVLFNAAPAAPLRPNVLRLRIQPHEGIAMQFQVKEPGPAMSIQPLMMDFDYASSFGHEPAEAYERLLLDAALGDSTLFTRSDEVEAAWRFVTPIIEAHETAPACPLGTYEAGTWGPKQADELIESDGRSWELMRRCVAQARVVK